MSRMVGGTFGVAVLGAIFQGNSRTVLESALSGAGIARRARSSRSPSSSAAAASTRRSPALPPDVAQQAGGAAHDAFICGLTTSIGISAAVAGRGRDPRLVPDRQAARAAGEDEAGRGRAISAGRGARARRASLAE